jgi:transposase-like protein
MNWTEFPLLFGAADGEDTDDSPDLDTGGESTTVRTLSAEEIDSMVARASSRGSRKAMKDLASELGFDTAGALKEWVSEQREKADAAKSEEQRVLEEARAASQDAAQQRRELANERLALRIERAVIRAGVSDPKKSSRIATLVKADINSEIDLDEDDAAWDTPIADAIESVKSDAPELFNQRAGFGSGDGGATGGSTADDEEQTRAAQEEQWTKEYAAKGWS